MGSELWEKEFSAFKHYNYSVDLWEEQKKIKLKVMNGSCPSKLKSQHSSENIIKLGHKVSLK